MARIDYHDIETGIKAVLEADAALTGVTVEVEREFPFGGADVPPWVGIYLESRAAPEDMQSLSAGTRTRYLLRFSLWCMRFSIESVEKAMELRDDLLGDVEIVLMKDRTLGGKVSVSWLEGGDMASAQLPSDMGAGFLAGAEIVMVADVTGTA